MSTLELPLFPLHSVLFPGMTLPLHIFEARYRLLISTCLRQDAPFGVVLIKAGEEVGEAAVPHQVGCTASITDVEHLEDGRMNIVAKGVSRFRLLDHQQHRAYLTGHVALLSEPVGDGPRTEALITAVRRQYRTYLGLAQMIAREGMAANELSLPYEPVQLSYFLAARLNVGRLEKQSLLELDAAAVRLDRELSLLRREVMVLRWLVERRRAGQDSPEKEHFPN